MTTGPRSWLKKLRESLPEQPMLVVPGHFFFLTRFTLDEGMSRAETEDYLALALEGESPFPVEHLAWGYFSSPGEREVLVYATTRQRLRTLGEMELEGFYQALPSFLTQAGTTFPENTVRFIAHLGSISAVFHAAGRRVPAKVVSRPIEGDLLSDDAAERARDRLLGELATEGYTVEAGLWIGAGHELDAKGFPVFRHRRIEAGRNLEEALHPLQVGDATLWAMDLRDSSYVTRRARERRTGRRLWLFAQVLFGFFFLLLLLQAGSWGLGQLANWIDDQLLARAPAQQRIENNRKFIDLVAENSGRGLDPIRMLEIVNEGRPPNIYFGRANARVYNKLTFEGDSRQGVDPFNNYVALLQRRPEILEVSSQTEIDQSQTRFTATVTFDPQALLAPAP